MKSFRSWLFLLALLVSAYLAYQHLGQRLESESKRERGEPSRYGESGISEDSDLPEDARPAMRKRGASGKAVPKCTTESGLIYQVLQSGHGVRPRGVDEVRVRYTGSFENGEVFDHTEGETAVSFALHQVIPGFREGLQLMRPGARFRFIIPPKLAYGDAGAGRKIPPGTTLVFEVELLEVTRVQEQN